MEESIFGKVPKDWIVKNVGEVFELSQGLQIASSKRIKNQKEGYIPLLKITDLPKGTFSEYVTGIRSNYIANFDDIIYTRTAVVGDVYTNYYGCIHNNCFKVNFNHEIFDKLYIYYYLKSPQVKKYCNSVAGGSVQKDLTHGAFKSWNIGYPSKDKQVKIGNILKKIDDKIELNNQMNQTLEEIAQNIFKEWFVEFNFPVEGEKLGYKASGGEMVESELGMIPKGWRVEELGSFISIKHGYAFKGKDFSDLPTKNIVLSPGNFKVGGGFKGNKFKYLLNEIIVPKDYIFNNNDLMVTMTDLSNAGDTLGYPAFIPSSKENIYLHNQRLGKVIHKYNFLNNYYLYQLMCTSKYRGIILGSATGTTVKHTAPKRIQEFRFPISKNNLILEEYQKMVSPLFKKLKINKEENQNLIKTRDALLPKLMSGEVRV